MASTFGKSFAREIGKDLGKVAMNVVFRDSWATPYRRVGSKMDEQSRAIRAAASAAHAEAAQMRAYSAQRKAEAEEKRAEIAQKESKYRLDTAVIANIDKLAAVPIPRQVDDLKNLIDMLSIQMKTIKYEDSGDEGEIRNKYLYALIEKYHQCLNVLKSINPKDQDLPQYKEVLEQREFDIFKYEAIGSSYLNDGDINKLRLAKIPSGGKILHAYMELLTVKLNSLDYDSVMITVDDSNEYLEELFVVYKEFLHAYKKEYPNDEAIARYAKTLADKEYRYYRKDFWHKKKKLLEYLSLSSIAIIFASVILLKNDVSSGGFLLPVGILMFLGLIALWAFNLKYRISLKSSIISEFSAQEYSSGSEYAEEQPLLRNEGGVKTNPEVAETVAQIIGGLENSFNVTVKKDEDLFFDLNEENRIGERLNVIWNKYSSVVSRTLMDRRPIFAADGVKDSILFVGVNPSYDPEDDNRFLENDDKRTLLYGSFYGRDDAPTYFKRLEMFAAELGKTYTQINLLYARENDRNKLLKTNPDFIREQLELTYDTIIKINPKAIIFFSSYCKTLIFGPGRWTDQSSFNEQSKSYILNGTNIPVFFTEDVTTLDANSVDDLIDRMKSLKL